MTLPPYAKAIVAAIAGAVVPPLTSAGVAAATSTSGPSGTTSVTESIVGLVVSGLLTYFVPNGQSVKDKASGIVVTLKTDADKFLAAVVAGLPDLVKNAAQAALAPAPPEAEAAPAVPVEPAPTPPPA